MQPPAQPPVPPVPPAEAVRRFPELAGVLALVRAGWKFEHRYDGDELIAIDGFYGWSPHVTDAIRITLAGGVFGCRTFNDEHGIVWQRDGGLAEVINGLLELHPPSHPMAPRLIIGRAPGPWIA